MGGTVSPGCLARVTREGTFCDVERRRFACRASDASQRLRIKTFALLDVCADQTGALVRYRASEFAGPGFANVERFEFTDDLIAHVEVYFGRDLG